MLRRSDKSKAVGLQCTAAKGKEQKSVTQRPLSLSFSCLSQLAFLVFSVLETLSFQNWLCLVSETLILSDQGLFDPDPKIFSTAKSRYEELKIKEQED